MIELMSKGKSMYGIVLRLILLLVLALSGSGAGNSNAKKGSSSLLGEPRLAVRMKGYIPPLKCGVILSVANKNVYLDVRGLNSTVFCRRVISTFEDDKSMTAISAEKEHEGIQVCLIKSSGFIVRVVSMDESKSSFAYFICSNFEEGISL